MKTHQIIHFKDGSKRTLFSIVGVKDNEFTHLKLEDGRKVLVNKENVNMIEVFNDDDAINKKTWGKLYNAYSANEDLTQLELFKDEENG